MGRHQHTHTALLNHCRITTARRVTTQGVPPGGGSSHAVTSFLMNIRAVADRQLPFEPVDKSCRLK
jgi:hypothetical protein